MLMCVCIKYSTYNAIRFVANLTGVVIAMKTMQVFDHLVTGCLRMLMMMMMMRGTKKQYTIASQNREQLPL